MNEFLFKKKRDATRYVQQYRKMFLVDILYLNENI